MSESESRYWSQEQIDNYLKKLEEYDSQEELKVDMHNHTTGSDGRETPLLLLLRAYRMGLRTISITDHDKVGGYEILKKQIDDLVSHAEDIDKREDLSEEEKKNLTTRANRLLKVISEMQIIPGCEVITCFNGCPYVEILAYGVDVEKLKENLKVIKMKKEAAGPILCEKLKEKAKQFGFESDLFYMENRSDYRKLFYHELKKHPENSFLYDSIEGKTEEEQAQDFAKKYIDNKESDYYVDLSDENTNRKNEMLRMVQKMKHEYPEVVFDHEVIRNAGAAANQFFNEVSKHPNDMKKITDIDSRMSGLKKFLYLGVYNKNSPFFIDLKSTKPSPEEVVEAIHNSTDKTLIDKGQKAKAIVAHYGRYRSSNPEEFDWEPEQGKGRQNLVKLIDLCDGAECAYPDNPMELRRLIYKLCRERGKYISIGGDSHGKRGKEGKQYQLGSQEGRKVEGLEWINDMIINGSNILQQLEEERQYRTRLKNIIERNRNESQKKPTNDKELEIQSEQGE